MVSIERESSTLQGSEYRKHLNNNWETIEDELNQLEELIKLNNDQKSTVATEELQDQIIGLKQRINRIVLGTDQGTIELVVAQILQEQGVID